MRRGSSARQMEKMRNATMIATTIATIFGSLLAVPAFAQGCDLSGSPRTTLRTPLIYGAPNEAPFQQAPEGQPPPVGDGSTPAPVTYGMGGPPTLIPSVPLTPANHIQYPSYEVPYSPATQAPPGVLGPSMWAPPPPSTPGRDPGMLHEPLDFHHPPAREVRVNPGGGISGSAPTQRWGGQTTRDFGRYKHDGTRKFDFGQGMYGQTSQDGPYQVLPGASSTYDLYGRRCASNNGQTNIQTIAPY